MSDRKINITLIIVFVVFILAAVGINFIADGVGLPEGISDTIGYVFLLGMLVLYIVYRQKENNEIAKIREENAKLHERVRSQTETLDNYKSEYSYYYNEYWKLKREKDLRDG